MESQTELRTGLSVEVFHQLNYYVTTIRIILSSESTSLAIIIIVVVIMATTIRSRRRRSESSAKCNHTASHRQQSHNSCLKELQSQLTSTTRTSWKGPAPQGPLTLPDISTLNPSPKSPQNPARVGSHTSRVLGFRDAGLGFKGPGVFF